MVGILLVLLMITHDITALSIDNLEILKSYVLN